MGPSQRPRLTPRLIPGWPMDMDTLMPTEPTGPTDTDTPTPTATTERDLLMLSPRPRPRLIPPSSTPTTDMLAITLDTPMPTTERGLLMLSPRPRLMLIPGTPMLAIPTPTLERGPLMPSPRPMPTTDTTATAGPTPMDTDTVDTEDTTTDKSSPRVQSKSSTRTSLLVNLTFHPSVRLLGGVGI